MTQLVLPTDEPPAATSQRPTIAAQAYRAAKRIVGRFPPWLIRFRPFDVYEIRLDQLLAKPDISSQSRRPHCATRWISSSADAAHLRSIAARSNIASLDEGLTHVATVAADNHIIGCAWVARGAFDERDLGLRISLDSPEAWLFAAVVLPQWRGQRVYGQLLEFVIGQLMQQGFRRILLGVTVGNEPSRRAHVRCGEIGAIVAIRSFGVSLCLRSGKVKRLSSLPIAWRRPISLTVDQ